MNDLSQGKPLPRITDLTRPFWDAARAGRLQMQKCSRCGTMNFHPKPWCIECGCRELPWTDAGPHGTVYAFTVSRSVAMNSPVWSAELPLILCLVDVDDGARMYAQLTDCSPAQVHVGMRVMVHFDTAEGELPVPRFRPLAQPDAHG
jgi:hypothetical protein